MRSQFALSAAAFLTAVAGQSVQAGSLPLVASPAPQRTLQNSVEQPLCSRPDADGLPIWLRHGSRAGLRDISQPTADSGPLSRTAFPAVGEGPQNASSFSSSLALAVDRKDLNLPMATSAAGIDDDHVRLVSLGIGLTQPTASPVRQTLNALAQYGPRGRSSYAARLQRAESARLLLVTNSRGEFMVYDGLTPIGGTMAMPGHS